ncbi:MAG TPA: PEP-CTERM sorting domain-containing protein [Pirellulaceae bacterium]|nr:PEP-CTERM sorting domain-containing protein [Pirellulaceae bacterium]HMO91580.1 PEP-CTERM sorting domain-containing protein [Pirellulaceae bacterium]HMP68277.1 PEP-CTERM sorting domain-containing protein [Pirellulaceae bacterium]
MRVKIGRVLSLCLFLSLGSTAAKADVVVPNYAAGSEATGAFFLFSTLAAGRTYQMTIAANQLTNIVGQQITGMQIRLNGGFANNWPPEDVGFDFFNVVIGPGVAPSAMSNTFADNFTGVGSTVRTGPLTIAAGSFLTGPGPNDFGPAITFDSGYLYNGGDLAIEFRFGPQISGTIVNPSFDAVPTAGDGWGSDFAARWTGNAAGTSGANGNFIVSNLIAIPEPTSGTLLLFAMAGMLLRRRSVGR